jgi:hypothetical protein
MADRVGEPPASWRVGRRAWRRHSALLLAIHGIPEGARDE